MDTCCVVPCFPRPFFFCSFLFSLPLRRCLRSAFSRGGVLRGVHGAPSSSSPRERTRFDLLDLRSESSACFFLELLSARKRGFHLPLAFLRAIIFVLLIISGIVLRWLLDF